MSKELEEFVNETNGSVITQEFADYLNHNFGNVMENGVVKQYVFRSGDSVSDVIDFMNKYYKNV